MINYSPINGDPSTAPVAYKPRTCFLMTQLGDTISKEVIVIRKDAETLLSDNRYDTIDANSAVTGRDFLQKIWEMIISVPLCVALIHRDMPTRTLCNIFYELGMAQSLGKETIIIKAKDTEIPSDFVRTEYVEYNSNFTSGFTKFISDLEERVRYYETLADSLDNNPLLSIDFLRRAFLLSGDQRFRDQANQIFEEAKLENRARNSVEMLLRRF